jgi:hypothetical protein
MLHEEGMMSAIKAEVADPSADAFAFRSMCVLPFGPMAALTSRPHLASCLLVLLLASACGRDDAPFSAANGGGGGKGAMQVAADGGPSGTGGTTDLSPPSAGDDSRPGEPASDLAQRGAGACAGVSLQQVIAAVHQGWPALADVTELYRDDPTRIGDGSFIYAFAHDGGFALVFKRGGGDCPAGCTENEYWYFVTDAVCAPTQVGHYGIAPGAGNCLMASGKPMWGLPRAPDPVAVCGADNTPAPVSGVYKLDGTGTRVACTEKAGAEPQMSVALALTLSVTQAAGDPAHGTVTLDGTGHPLIDGQPIPATFTRRRFTAARETSNLPATCIDQHTIQIRHDFESGLPGRLDFFEVKALGCPPSQAYCKGTIGLDLTIVP